MMTMIMMIVVVLVVVVVVKIMKLRNYTFYFCYKNCRKFKLKKNNAQISIRMSN